LYTSGRVEGYGFDSVLRTAGKKVKVGCGGFAYCIWMFPQHSSSQDGMMDAGVRTAMTRRRPSRTSRSCRLSSNFLICCAGNGLVGLRGPTSLAASRVRSRAGVSVSGCCSKDDIGRRTYPSPAGHLCARWTPFQLCSVKESVRACSRVSWDRSREAGWTMVNWSTRRTSDFTAKQATTMFLDF
jgi:hypothetical protein